MLDFRNNNISKYSTLSLLASPKMGRTFPRSYTKSVDNSDFFNIFPHVSITMLTWNSIWERKIKNQQLMGYIPQDMFMRLHFVSFLHLPRDFQGHVWRHHSDVRKQFWCRFKVDIHMIKVIKFQHHIHKGLAVISIFRALGSTWTPEHQLKVNRIILSWLFFNSSQNLSVPSHTYTRVLNTRRSK